MNDHHLDRLLADQPPGTSSPARPAVNFADAILARLPGMRMVIPGSHPGSRVLVLAGILGLVITLIICFTGAPAEPEPAALPPPLPLFQADSVEIRAPLPRS